MAQFANEVWDGVANGGAGGLVRWLTEGGYDPYGDLYPGPGVFGVDTSNYVQGEVYGIETGVSGAASAIHTDRAAEISSLAEKAVPVDADVVVIEDSAAGNSKKKVQLSNMLGGGVDPTAVHTDGVGEINGLTEKADPVGADVLILEDSAASWAKKKVSITNVQGSTADFLHYSVDDEFGTKVPYHVDGLNVSDRLLVEKDADYAKVYTVVGDLAEVLAGLVAPEAHALSHETGGDDALTHDNLSGAGTNSHSTIDSHLGATDNPHSVSASQVGNGTAQWNANKIQDFDISTTDPTDGQVLVYDAGVAKYVPQIVSIATAPPSLSQSYRELGLNEFVPHNSPSQLALSFAGFDGGLHAKVFFRASLLVSWTTTGTMTLRLYDDGPWAGPPDTPRLVATIEKTDDGGYENFSQELSIVSSAPTTNEILDTSRVYRVTAEVNGTSGDFGLIGSVGLEAEGVTTIAKDRLLSSGFLEVVESVVVEQQIGGAGYQGHMSLGYRFIAVVDPTFDTTGTVTLRLYDDGPAEGPPATPRLVASLVTTDEGSQELYQALTVVNSGASTNEILSSRRIYRVTVECDAAAGDFVFISSAALEVG